jgi:hypothetical protein
MSNAFVINLSTFVCSIPFLVVVFAYIVGAMFIYSCHYEETSYTLVTYLCMSQWCDNDNHDLPQHVTRHVKWRDDVDGNKCRSVLISLTLVTDAVSTYTCHYMLFPFLLLHAACF